VLAEQFGWLERWLAADPDLAAEPELAAEPDQALTEG